MVLSLVAAPALAQTTGAYNPRACDASTVVTGGTAVTAVKPPFNNYYIVNPSGATEPLFVDPSGTAATTTASGTNSSLVAGQTLTVLATRTRRSASTRLPMVTSSRA